MRFTLLAIILTLGLLKPSIINAEEPVVGWKVSTCMKIQECKPIKEDDNDAIKCSGGSAHLNRLRPDTSKTLPPNTDVYLIECVKVNADETYCTTADPNLDLAIQPLQGHLNTLITKVEYNAKERGEVRFYDSEYSSSQIGEGFTKLATDASGNLILPGGNKIIRSIEWKSHTPKHLPRNFKLWTPIQEEIILPEEQPQEGIGGQQQAILTFPTSTGGDAICGGFISYDPEGRVFDAITLDPIPNVNLTLLQSDTNTINGNYSKEAVNKYNTEYTIVNPVLTKAKDFENIVNAPFLVGSFNFFVVDGFYKLVAAHNDYEFLDASNFNKLPANANKIYSGIYFNDSPPIHQQGAIEHRDIPLFPKDGVGKTYPETFHLMYDTNELISATKTQYVGQVSHPFAKATVAICRNVQGIETCGDLKNISTTQGAPDKEGKFSIELNQSTLESGQHYKVLFEPVILTNITIASRPHIWDKIISYLSAFSIATPVSAQTPSVSRTVEPIPTYLEGYAYDQQGNIIPNVLVAIYVPFASAPMIQTKADNNGHFRITSEYLPDTEYTLVYSKESDSSEKATLTSSAFLAQNKEFMTVEDIDPYLITTRETNPRRNVTPSYVPAPQISIVPNTFSDQPETPEATSTEQITTNNSLFLIGAIMLLLVAAAGTLIGVHLYRKRMQQPEM